MELFQSHYLTYLFDSLQMWENICEKAKTDGITEPSPDDEREPQTAIAKLFGQAFEFCKKVGFSPAAAATLEMARTRLISKGKRYDYSALLTEILAAKAMLFHEHWSHAFVAVPERHRETVNKDNLFGDEVSHAFKSAVPDIREAGNCLVVGCSTAAVFHSMRAVEWGLRALAAHLGKTSVKCHRRGKVVYKPLPYSEWETILNQLGPLVDKRIEAMKQGPKKQTAQEFYYPALLEIRAMRDAWRNHVMHTRAEYSPEAAEAIMGHVERLMRMLATRIKEA